MLQICYSRNLEYFGKVALVAQNWGFPVVVDVHSAKIFKLAWTQEGLSGYLYM